LDVRPDSDPDRILNFEFLVDFIIPDSTHQTDLNYSKYLYPALAFHSPMGNAGIYFYSNIRVLNGILL